MTLQEALSEVHEHYLVLQNKDVVQPNSTSFKTSSYLELHQYQVVFLWVPAPWSIHPSPKRFPKRLQLLEVEIATVTLCLWLSKSFDTMLLYGIVWFIFLVYILFI